VTRHFAKAHAVFVLGALASMLVAGSADALDWPTRSVSVVVPIAAGGNTDMMARIGAEGLAEKFGKPFIVENRSSAGGAVGVSQVARSNPDGYTLLFAASTMTYLTPMLQKVDFDPDKDITPITNIGTGAQLLGIRKSLPVTNLSELIAYAKANPGRLNCVVVTQTLSHLVPALMFGRAGVDVVFIPARGGPQSVSDLMSGQVDMYFGTASEMLPHVDSDKIRLIAVATEKRLDAAPNIPTVAESYPGFSFSSFNGFFVPSGTPDDIVAALRIAVSEVATSPAVAKRLNALGIVPGGLGTERMLATLKADRLHFEEASKAAGLRK
jgi:tripartite-type tricarboxylate transporter receptor subunit TctC